MMPKPRSLRRALVLAVAACLFASHPAAATPGGRHGSIAFSSYRGERQDIYSMRPDGTHVRNLTDDVSPDFQPAWSPDGTRIAFTSLHPRQSELNQIYTMDARGNRRVRLTDMRLGNPLEPAWSPDGTQIAFYVDYGGPIDSELFVMNADGSDRRQLTHNKARDSDPAWTVDGSRIAFVRDARVMSIDPDTGLVQPITPAGMSAFDPAWSPDGQWLAFVGRPSIARGTDLYVMRADGTQIRLLRSSDPIESDPSWSPNGRRIVYALTRYHYENHPNENLICTIRSDGKRRRVLSSDSHLRDSGPDWRRSLR